MLTCDYTDAERCISWCLSAIREGLVGSLNALAHVLTPGHLACMDFYRDYLDCPLSHGTLEYSERMTDL